MGSYRFYEATIVDGTRQQDPDAGSKAKPAFTARRALFEPKDQRQAGENNMGEAVPEMEDICFFWGGDWIGEWSCTA